MKETNPEPCPSPAEWAPSSLLDEPTRVSWNPFLRNVRPSPKDVKKVRSKDDE